MTTTMDLQTIDHPMFIPVEAEPGHSKAAVAEAYAAELRETECFALASFRAGLGGWDVRVLPWA